MFCYVLQFLLFFCRARSDEKLFALLALAAEPLKNVFKAQALANTAWAFATANLCDEQLFTVLARAAEQRVNEFNVRGSATQP